MGAYSRYRIILLHLVQNQVQAAQTDLSILQQMYPDVERLQVFDKSAQVVMSEPFAQLPGAFLEVPEATVAILDGTGYHHQPFLAQ